MRLDAQDAENLLAAFRRAGGVALPWMYDMLINMHARRRDLPASLAVKNTMAEHGTPPTLCAQLVAAKPEVDVTPCNGIVHAHFVKRAPDAAAQFAFNVTVLT